MEFEDQTLMAEAKNLIAEMDRQMEIARMVNETSGFDVHTKIALDRLKLKIRYVESINQSHANKS